MTELKEPTKRTLPVVSFIGILLLIKGLNSAWGFFATTRTIIVYGKDPYIHGLLLNHSVHNAIALLFGIASIIIGIGLLRYATWARRGAVILFLCSLVYWALSPAFDSYLNKVIVSNSMPIRPNYLYQFFEYAILLLFVESLSIRRRWGEENPGFFTQVAETVLSWMPKATPSILVLISLLLFRFAGNDLWMSWEAVAQAMNLRQSPEEGFLIWLNLLYNPIFNFALGFLIMGIGLLWLLKWVLSLGILALAIALIQNILQFIKMCTDSHLASWQYQYIFGIIITAIAILISYMPAAVFIIFIAQSLKLTILKNRRLIEPTE